MVLVSASGANSRADVAVLASARRVVDAQTAFDQCAEDARGLAMAAPRRLEAAVPVDPK